jgi:hypothetical protein
MSTYIFQRLIMVSWAVFFANLARWNGVWDAIWSVLGFLAVALTVEAMKTEDLSRKSLSRTQNIVVWCAVPPLAVLIAFLFYVTRTCLPAHYGQVFPFILIFCLCAFYGLWAQRKIEEKTQAPGASKDPDQGA